MYGYRVDAIQLSNRNPDLKFDKKTPGCFHLEPKCVVAGNTTVKIGDEKEWEWQPREWKELKTREEVIEHVKAGRGVNITGMVAQVRTSCCWSWRG